MKKITHGFTLIEVMIAAAIVAILAAVAYPSYQDSVRKSRRADAKAVLLQAGQWMERFYTENNRYDQDRAGTTVATRFAASGLTQAPIDGATKYYNITLTNVSAPPLPPTFTLNAAPIVGTGQQNDQCGGMTGVTLTLNEANQKGVNGTTNPTIIGECWR